jgi:hypothetical protein
MILSEKKIHAINIFLKLKKNTSETRRKKLVKILIRITYHKYINKKYIYHISTKYIIGIYLAKLYWCHEIKEDYFMS